MIKKNFMVPVIFTVATVVVALIVAEMFLLAANSVVNSTVINVAMGGIVLGLITSTVAVTSLGLKLIDLAFQWVTHHEAA